MNGTPLERQKNIFQRAIKGPPCSPSCPLNRPPTIPIRESRFHFRQFHTSFFGNSRPRNRSGRGQKPGNDGPWISHAASKVNFLALACRWNFASLASGIPAAPSSVSPSRNRRHPKKTTAAKAAVVFRSASADQWSSFSTSSS